MSIVHFRSLDLNLFRVLLALLERRSVSGAAVELSLTPSAVSHALNRLRTALDDPLFERRGGALLPTAYALEVGRRARPAMEQLRDAIGRIEFNPKLAEREFVLAAGSYATAIFVPRLLERMRAAAPRVRLRMKRVDAPYLEEVEHGRVDAAFGVSAPAAKRLEWRPLLTDSMAWVARRGHPFLREPLTIDMLTRARHVIADRFGSILPSEYDEARRFLDETAELRSVYETALETSGQTNRCATVSDVAQALEIVRRTDCVTLTLRRLAEAMDSDDLQIMKPPHPTPSVEIGAIYHREKLRDPGFAWLMDMLASSVV